MFRFFHHGMIVFSFTALMLSGKLQAAGVARPAIRGIEWQPAKLVPGSPVLFQIPASKSIQDVSAHWFGHEVTFFRAADASGWYALAAVPIETAPGNHDLVVNEKTAAGKSAEIRKTIRIARATYPKIAAKVAKQFTEPNPEQLKEINADKSVKQQTFANVTPQKLWEGSFVAPVAAPISDIFGTARVFNGEVLSRHQGLDFGVPAGTPIGAINAGTVLLARPLYFEGNCVVIDHGQGLLSLYLHLSEFKVKEGDEVQAHQIIGLSGGSGRATGPHLHLAVRWQGVYLDPATLLKLKIP
jgi:murein DD-endopeptidase MepM/ murein hydrolase activator NlpD